MKQITVNLKDRSYPIYIEYGILDSVGEFLKNKLGTISIFLVTDAKVAGIYQETVLRSFTNSGFDVVVQILPEGEATKSLNNLGNLHTSMIESNLRRDSAVVALGGGVIGDLAGFAAATYLRGVPLIQIPTTLLSQVDSSVGGKTGINHPLGKNLIGSFYQPKMVLIDPDTLSTLETREFWAGMAEVLKYGLIGNTAFFKELSVQLQDLSKLTEKQSVLNMLATCCEMKADIVQKDETEGGLRRILNFGHTLGHALESSTQYGYFKHGEAVIYGMRWACWVSFKHRILDEETFHRIERVLLQVPVPPIPNDITPEILFEKIQTDKKQTQSGLLLVLLETIGKTRIDTINQLLQTIKGWFNEIIRA